MSGMWVCPRLTALGLLKVPSVFLAVVSVREGSYQSFCSRTPGTTQRMVASYEKWYGYTRVSGKVTVKRMDTK